MNTESSPPGPPNNGRPVMAVRYSLPEMLAELKLERASGSFAMEKLEQADIGKLFKTQARRRAKPNK